MYLCLKYFSSFSSGIVGSEVWRAMWALRGVSQRDSLGHSSVWNKLKNLSIYSTVWDHQSLRFSVKTFKNSNNLFKDRHSANSILYSNSKSSLLGLLFQRIVIFETEKTKTEDVIEWKWCYSINWWWRCEKILNLVLKSLFFKKDFKILLDIFGSLAEIIQNYK